MVPSKGDKTKSNNDNDDNKKILTLKKVDWDDEAKTTLIQLATNWNCKYNKY